MWGHEAVGDFRIGIALQGQRAGRRNCGGGRRRRCYRRQSGATSTPTINGYWLMISQLGSRARAASTSSWEMRGVVVGGIEVAKHFLAELVVGEFGAQALDFRCRQGGSDVDR